jgi:fluoroquinolone resistance protein
MSHMNSLFEELTFTGKDFKNHPLEAGDYELCVFIECDFSNVNLSKFQFIECEFFQCNLSSCKVVQTGFQEVKFDDCKMIGINFEQCKDFSFSISTSGCQLDHSMFFKKKLARTQFIQTRLREVDFTESNLHEAVFDQCDLTDAVFEHTDLRNTDFRGSHGFVIDPESNTMKGAKFSLSSVTGLLAKYGLDIEQN